ncbi:MAG: hypothetical protein GY832_42760 [Chloroflexi bacterium]|nr:hypothetical protein [Chloroflexota bacterium]
MQHEITINDIGRGITFVRTADWIWHAQPDGTVVLDVQTVYPSPGVCVKIGHSNRKGYWYSVADIRLAQA